MFKSDELKAKDALSRIVEGIRLNDIISKDFMDFLQKKYGEEFDVCLSDMVIHIRPKETSEEERGMKIDDKKKIKQIQINISQTPFIRLQHPGPIDFEKKKIILSSSNYDLIKKFLEK